MKKFQFSLQTVLDLRLREEKYVQKALALAVSEVVSLQDQARECRNATLLASKNLALEFAGGNWASTDLYRRKLLFRQEEIQAQLIVALARCEEIQEEYRKARSARRSMEKLKDKHHEIYRKDKKKEEIGKADELSSVRFSADKEF